MENKKLKYSKSQNGAGADGYDVIVENKKVGFVYKATLRDLSTYWVAKRRDGGDDTIYTSRKQAAESLIEVEGGKPDDSQQH